MEIQSIEFANCMQVGEILGILPNKACKGASSRILMDPQTSSSESLNDDKFDIILPVTEIPKWLNLNHESDRDVVSFWVGRKFPNIFYVCFAFGPANYPRMSSCEIFLSINGCEKKLLTATPIDADELSDDLWIFSLSNYELQKRLNESNPSELNYVEVICEIKDRLVVMDWVKNHPRRWGVRVECICCSQKSDVLHLPSPSARHNCCGSGMDQWAVNNGGDSGHLCGRQRRNHRPTYARRRQKHYLSHFGWFRIRFRLWKRSSRPTLPTATLMSRYLLFYYSLSLFGKSKKMKQTSYLCVFFWETQGLRGKWKKIQGFQWPTLISMMVPTPSCIHHQRRQENLD